MANQIKLLKPEVIGKIAAGEVVERPSAAIKELVENSLDAGASAVTVEIRDGGISFFRVTDNGSGIRQSEIRMAFERHATSKITDAEDLTAISTLGFRGEALASIAAVSQVTCTTRTKEDASGIRVLNEGGVLQSIEETACPVGTTFVVKNLFFNTPVRLKFLKKPSTEAGFVSDLMMRLILSRPDVSFRYVSQGKSVYHSAGDGKLESAVFSIYGSEMTHYMRPVHGSMNGVLLDGYVGISEAARSNRSHQSFFVNGRYFRSSLLSAAVEEACRERVMIGKYPTCVLHLTMPFEQVDVNVHPNKLEVRFQNEIAVSDAVTAIVYDALQDRDAFERPKPLLLNPEPAVPKTADIIRQEPAAVQSEPLAQAKNDMREAAGSNPAVSAQESRQAAAPSQTPLMRDSGAAVDSYLIAQQRPVPVSAEQQKVSLPKETKQEEHQETLPVPDGPLRVFGTLFQTYILIEYKDHLLLIDQHAVHERLLYERFMAQYDQQEAGQELLIPAVISVSQQEQDLLLENQDILERLGFCIEPIGAKEVAVRSVPMILGEPQTAGFLRDMLDQLQKERGVLSMEKRRNAILQQACKHAVKGGEPLTDAEIRDLVTRMIDEKVTPTCPHGRPLVVALSHYELDKRFKRIQ